MKLIYKVLIYVFLSRPRDNFLSSIASTLRSESSLDTYLIILNKIGVKVLANRAGSAPIKVLSASIEAALKC